MAQNQDPRRTANTQRLRRLKAIALGLSAAIAVALWSLVGGAIASAQPSATTHGSITQPLLSNDGGFFNGGQRQSLGGGSTGSRPILRSGGS